MVNSYIAGNLCFLEAKAEEVSMVDRIFGLDAQILFDAAILACAVLFLFFLISYLVFNPARNLLKKRQEKIQKEMEDAAKDKEDAIQFKAEYEARLKTADKAVEQILSEGKKKAQKREQQIVDEAKDEADRIMVRASKEAELEKSKVRDEVKQEIVSVAKEMAGRFLKEEIDANKQAELVDEVLQEMGEGTWQE